LPGPGSAWAAHSGGFRSRRQSDFEELEPEPELVLEDEEPELEELEDEVPSEDDFEPSDGGFEPSDDDFELDSPPSLDDDDPVRPLAEADDERESVMYQPLPLKTIPTG